MCVHIPAYGSWTPIWVVFLNHSPSYLRRGHPWTGGVLICLAWEACELQRSSCPWSLSAWITHVHAMPDEYTVLEIKVLLLHQDPHCWSCPPASSFSVSFDEHCLFSFFSLGIMWADFLGSFAITWRRVDITQTFPLYWITMIIELLKTTFYLQHFPSY